MTMEYIQVLISLYCNKSRTGSYCPKNFKNIISEYNPLFKGIQANDSKDLIIFLLE
jgi:ubiquitin C-terminal hydrolase